METPSDPLAGQVERGLATFSPASIAVDRLSPVPLYFQVAQQLEHAIQSGQLRPGMRLDNELDLAEVLRVSRPTLRRAMEYLVDRGYLVRKRGLGTRVLHPKVRRPLELTSLWDHLERSGKRPRTVVRSLRTVPTTDSVALALDLDEGAEVVAMERLRYADDQPLAVMRNWIPRGLVELSAERLERTGLWQLMRAAGIRPHLAWQTIGARTATAAEARLLRAANREPVLTMQVTTYTDAGQPVEFGNHIYLAALYSFEIPLLSR